MDNFIEFISFQNPTLRVIAIGIFFLSISSAMVGCFSFLRKQSLIGDAVAHGVLPGICLSFLLFENKNIYVLLWGASLTAWLSIATIQFVYNRSKIDKDTSMGIILSVFFGFGIVLLTIIQGKSASAQAGLDKFIFGKAASMIDTDVITIVIISVFIIITIILLYKNLVIVSFDESFAKTIGLKVGLFKFILTMMTVLVIVIGIQSVGIVLISALLITPPVTARFWTNKLNFMILIACVFSIISGFGGTYISYTYENMPTGPWIVVFMSIFAFISFAIAPQKGFISKLYNDFLNKRKIEDENILKTMYALIEDNPTENYSLQSILKKKMQNPMRAKNTINRLCNQGFITKVNEHLELTHQGLEKGKRITRLHRLWELYLTKNLHLLPSHVHEDAETIEHIITPELEERIIKELGYPTTDPHNKIIP